MSVPFVIDHLHAMTTLCFIGKCACIDWKYMSRVPALEKGHTVEVNQKRSLPEKDCIVRMFHQLLEKDCIVEVNQKRSLLEKDCIVRMNPTILLKKVLQL